MEALIRVGCVNKVGLPLLYVPCQRLELFTGKGRLLPKLQVAKANLLAEVAKLSVAHSLHLVLTHRSEI